MRVVSSTGKKGILCLVPPSRLLEICLYWHTWSPILPPVIQSLPSQYVPKRLFCL